jgi:hypothetical protein
MTEGNAAPAPERLTRKRGVGFPVVGLPEAVEVMRKAGQYGSEHELGAFAGYMGHSTANSGSFKRRIAAFKDWKFIAGGTGDRVVFTDLGRRVAYPNDSGKEKNDLREAFRNCDIFWKVYDESAKGVPFSLETLANVAVRQLGVAPISKDRFAESLAESAVAAGFAEMDSGRISFVGPGDEKVREARSAVVYDDERMVEDSGGWLSPEDSLDDDLGPAGERAWGLGRRPAGDRRRLYGGGTVPPGLISGRREPNPVAAPSGREEPLPVPGAPVGFPPYHGLGAGRAMAIERPPEPVEEKPAVLHQQSWEFQAGNLVFEIRSSRTLPASAFMQIGKVMSEIEKLRDLLTEGSDRSEEPGTERAE